MALVLLLTALLAAGGLAQATASPALDLSDCVFVVDLRGVSPDRQLAASVAVGLLNRAHARPAALALNSPTDWRWVAGIRDGGELAGACWVAASDADILAYAVAVGAAKGTVAYNPAEPWSLATVVTLAGVRQAIPVPHAVPAPASDVAQQQQQPRFQPALVDLTTGVPPRGSASLEWRMLGLTLGLDALGPASNASNADPFQGVRGLAVSDDVSGRWRGHLDATLWAWANLHKACKRTDEIIVIQRPEVLSQGFLADFIAAERLFAFFLPTVCSPGPQQVLFRSLVAGAHARGRQLKVMGYSIEDEVVADCTQHHTEISLVSDWCPNLSFYSRMAPLAAQLPQVPLPPAPAFDPNHTYLAVINSDGDNMQMENNGNRDGMEARVRLCAEKGSACPPLGWTMSNQLATFAPFQLRWYYEQAALTGRDSFLMGPSGFGFLHPAAIAVDSPLLTAFVTDTIAAAANLSMRAYVHWDIDANGLQQRSMASRGPFEPAAAAATEPVGAGRRLLAGVHGTQQQQQRQTAIDSNSNSLAREAFIRRFEGSAINSVFAPGEYNVPDWIGGVAGIHEQYRWGKEMPTAEAIERADTLPRGTIGYIYKIFEVAPIELEHFGRSIAPHVHILDHRQLYDLALQKKLLHATQ